MGTDHLKIGQELPSTFSTQNGNFKVAVEVVDFQEEKMVPRAGLEPTTN
jgi:hypothetical protein